MSATKRVSRWVFSLHFLGSYALFGQRSNESEKRLLVVNGFKQVMQLCQDSQPRSANGKHCRRRPLREPTVPA